MPAADVAVSGRARRKVFVRLLPWLLALYVIAYLDRVNVSFATLEMSADLGFSPAVYGFCAGIFFVGYFLLEVPGAVIAQRWSVRRWLFILEGFPAIVLGVATLWMIPEKPADAAWLDDAEKQWLEARLAREAAERRARDGGTSTLWRAFRDPGVLLFAAAYFFGLVASNGLGFWLPTMVKSLSGLSTLTVTLLVSLPYSLGFVAKLVAGWSSDRTGDRRWHTVGLLGVGAAGLVGGALGQGSPLLALLFICVAVIGLTGYSPSFWAYALSMLGGTAGAAAIGLINSIGNLGSFVGPYLMGWIRQSSDAFTLGVLVLAGSAVITAILVLIATPRRSSAP